MLSVAHPFPLAHSWVAFSSSFCPLVSLSEDSISSYRKQARTAGDSTLKRNPQTLRGRKWGMNAPVSFLLSGTALSVGPFPSNKEHSRTEFQLPIDIPFISTSLRFPFSVSLISCYASKITSQINSLPSKPLSSGLLLREYNQCQTTNEQRNEKWIILPHVFHLLELVKKKNRHQRYSRWGCREITILYVPLDMGNLKAIGDLSSQTPLYSIDNLNYQHIYRFVYKGIYLNFIKVWKLCKGQLMGHG